MTDAQKAAYEMLWMTTEYGGINKLAGDLGLQVRSVGPWIYSVQGSGQEQITTFRMQGEAQQYEKAWSVAVEQTARSR